MGRSETFPGSLANRQNQSNPYSRVPQFAEFQHDLLLGTGLGPPKQATLLASFPARSQQNSTHRQNPFATQYARNPYRPSPLHERSQPHNLCLKRQFQRFDIAQARSSQRGYPNERGVSLGRLCRASCAPNSNHSLTERGFADRVKPVKPPHLNVACQALGRNDR